MLNPERDDIKELAEEIIPISRGVAVVGVGEGETGMYINGGENIPFESSRKDVYGINLNQVTR